MRKYIQIFLISILFALGFSVAKSQLPEDIIISQPQPIVKCYDTQDEYLDLLVNVNTNLYDYYVQWYKENNKIGNLQKNDTRLIFPSLNYSHSAKYKAEVIVVEKGNDPILNPLKSQFTNEVLVYVLAKTEIIRHPKTVELVKTGDKVEFSFEAHTKGIIGSKNDSEVKIEWFKGNKKLIDDNRIAGTKSSVLTIKKIQQSDFGLDYRVVVTAECGTDTSDYFGIVQFPRLLWNGTGLDVKCAGEELRLHLNIRITDGSPLKKQWYKNGEILQDGPGVRGSSTETLYIVLHKNDTIYHEVISLKYGFSEKFLMPNSLHQGDLDSTKTGGLRMFGWYVNAGPIVYRQPQSLKLKEYERGELRFYVDDFFGTKYQWYKDSQKFGFNSSKVIINFAAKEDAGTYYCVATNECHSVTSDTVTVEFDESAIYMGLDDINPISIYPNPSTERITLDLIGIEFADLLVYDILGNEIMSIPNYTNKSEIDISNLSIGTYIIQVQTKTGISSQRFVKY